MTQPEPEEREYVVRLLMTVVATNESEAADMFVEELVSKGLRNWVYAVLDDKGVVIGEFNGYGENVTADIDALIASQTEPLLNQIDTVELPADEAATPGQTDEELAAFADSLNSD